MRVLRFVLGWRMEVEGGGRWEVRKKGGWRFRKGRVWDEEVVGEFEWSST